MEKQPWPPETTILYLKLLLHHSPKKFSNFLLFQKLTLPNRWLDISLYRGLFKMKSKQWYLRTIFIISDMHSFSILRGPFQPMLIWDLPQYFVELIPGQTQIHLMPSYGTKKLLKQHQKHKKASKPLQYRAPNFNKLKACPPSIP